MSLSSSPVRYVIIGVLALPIIFILLIAAPFLLIMPGGSPQTINLYQSDAATTFSEIHWQDAYILDYFRYQNDFDQLTPTQIQDTINLFYKTERTTQSITSTVNGKTVTTTKTTTRKVAVSLLDVMTELGYSQQDYQDALQLEEILPDDSGSSAAGPGPSGPLAPVTVTELEFHPVSAQALYAYVAQKESLFTLEDMQSLIAAAQKYNVSAVLLLAITGQECSFDPVWIDHAAERHLNPWDVYVSYEYYHPGFAQSAIVAAATLHDKLTTPPPNGENAIQWINDPKNPDGIYATDRNWAYGLDDIYQVIMDYLA